MPLMVALLLTAWDDEYLAFQTQPMEIMNISTVYMYINPIYMLVYLQAVFDPAKIIATFLQMFLCKTF